MGYKERGWAISPCDHGYELTERAKKEYATKKDSELSPGLRMANNIYKKMIHCIPIRKQ